MSPQLENGYTRIADEIIENVYKMKLSGGKLRIILVVWRYTYGFNRKSTDLSISFISKATGIHKQQVKTELKELISMGILIVTKVATFNTSREFAFNKHFSYEEVKKVTGSKNSTPTGSKPSTTTGSESTPQDKEPIDNTIDINHEEALLLNILFDYERIRKLYPGKKTVATAKKKLPTLIKKYTGNQIFKTVERYIKDVDQRRKKQPDLSYLMESTFLNGRFEDYLDENYTEVNAPINPTGGKINRNAPKRGNV